MRIWHQLRFWGLCWVVAGCAGVGLGERLAPVAVDSSFSGGTLRFTDHGDLAYFVRIFEKDGRIAACGVAIHTGGSGHFGETLFELWMEEATLHLRLHYSDESRPLVSARFMRFERANATDKQANCVLTEMKAERRWIDARPYFSGVPVSASF